jgi:hypothetical protein
MFSYRCVRGAESPRARIVVVVAAVSCQALSVPVCADPFDYSSKWYASGRAEVRFGALASIWGPERGSVDVNAEIVLPKWTTGASPAIEKLMPRLKLGGMYNAAGKTNFVYADAMWTIPVGARVFLEPYIGIAVHDGQLNGPDPGLASLGCRVLGHAGVNLGYRLDAHWSIMVSYDHASNGKSISRCPTNQSLNLFGARVGYAF